MTGDTELVVPDPAAEADEASGRPRAMRAGLTFVGVCAVLLLAALAMQMRRPSTGVIAGEAAPDFTLHTYDGDTLHLADLRGQVIVLNFWASWCVSCVYEAAELQQLSQEYDGRGVVFLGVAYTDTEPAARDYLERHGVTYPNGPDRGGSISSAYRLVGVPETVVIDQTGAVVGLQVQGEAVPQAKITGPITSETAFSPADLRNTLDTLVLRAGP